MNLNTILWTYWNHKQKWGYLDEGGYLDKLLDAAEKVTENYGMQDKVDVEDIIKIIGEPFKYMRQFYCI